MMAELSLLVKVTAVLILALAAAWLGSRRSAAVRSLILACAFGLLLALPIVSLVLPTWAIEVPATYSSAPLARGPVTAVAPFAGSTAAAGAPASRARLEAAGQHEVPSPPPAKARPSVGCAWSWSFRNTRGGRIAG